ncbi:MAG: MMPL family transporter, partial [Actinobacteria bacterium]|nr:MMPL family transporter [Actinomycetota bacterium]
MTRLSRPGADRAASVRRLRPAVGRLARAYAFTVVSLRYPILLGWLAAALLAVLFLPSLPTSGGVGDLIPKGSPAVRAEYDATRLFGAPLNAPVAVVQEDPHRLPLAAQMRAARSAIAVDRGQARPIPGLAGALPVTNTGGLLPGSRARSTTVITFLYFRPGTSIVAQVNGGHAYARRYFSAPGDHLAGVTGSIPARYAQGQLIQRYLPWVEGATLLAIALIVGLYFRAVGAPLATLACAATAYLLAVRVVAWAAHRMGVAVPPDLEPVLAVLLLGVTTDYSVFFLSGMRTRLAAGEPRIRAARLTTAEFAPIILTAGLVVAAGTAALVVARMQLLRAFGPGLALTVLTAMVVSITLAPALIAIFGGLLFRPGPARLRRAALRRDGTAAARRPGALRQRWVAAGGRATRVLARVATVRPVALVLLVLVVAALLAAATEARNLRLGSPLVQELPASSGPARASTAASRGFVPGIMSPTEILVRGPGVAGQRAALDRLQHTLARPPGVAGVVGPADVPGAAARLHLMRARSGDAARFGVIERTDP